MSKSIHPETGEHTLEQHINAALPVPTAAVDAAQGRLLARLHGSEQRRPARSGTRWLGLAAAASVALALLLALPLLTLTGSAFAAVLEHFRKFSSLAMHVEQRANGQLIQTTDVLMGADGSLRSDVGNQLSVIVDASRHEMLTLLHGPAQAMLQPMPATGDSAEQKDIREFQDMQWLQEMAEFQGMAQQLPQTRIIAGQTATGWSLDLGSTPLVLWANADGLPLEMELKGASDLQLRYDFRFNVDVPAGRLSSVVPAGYTLVGDGGNSAKR